MCTVEEMTREMRLEAVKKLLVDVQGYVGCT